MIERGIDRETAGEMADTILRMADYCWNEVDTKTNRRRNFRLRRDILKNMKTGGKNKRCL